MANLMLFRAHVEDIWHGWVSSHSKTYTTIVLIAKEA